MTRTTTGIVFAQVGEVEVRSVQLPDLGPDDVGIRTVFSGVSIGTERWVLTGRYNRMGQDSSRRYPAFPGYQAAGIVEEIGSNVSNIRIGDPVLVQGTRFEDPSINWPDHPVASHAAYLVANANSTTRLQPTVDLAAASLFRLAAVARHGVRLANVQNGELVAVIGQGMIGQMAAQAARMRGARVISSDLIPLRVAASAKYSSDHAINASAEDLLDAVRNESADGADVVIDTTGDSRMLNHCLELIRTEGRISMQGYYPDPITIDFHPTHLKRPTVTFPCGWDENDDRHIAADLASGSLAIAPLITHRMNYEDAPAAYRLIIEHPGNIIGLVFRWSEE